MQAHFLDPYRPRTSPVHALDARVKLPLAVAFIVVVALIPPAAYPVYALLTALAFSTALLSELGIGYVLKRAALAAPFMLAALPLLFTVPGPPLWHITASPWTLVVTGPGLTRTLGIVLKSWLSVQMAVVLAASTPLHELLGAMRAWRVPRLLVAVVALMWRYLFILVDEAGRLLRAREARSGEGAWDQPAGRARGAGGTLAWRAQVAGGMAGNLFLRSFDRADRVYAAMLARGYDGEIRSLPAPPVPNSQRALLAAGLVLLALMAGLGRLIWSGVG